MLILTLSSYAPGGDEHAEGLQGIFPDMEHVVAYIESQRWNGVIGDITDFDYYTNPKPKNGMVRIAQSKGFLDDGYGGNYYSVWKAA